MEVVSMRRAEVPAVRDHAVVLGAGIAGLCTAAVLTRHFARVTLVERDQIKGKAADGSRGRRGVPQSPHIHTVLTRAAQEMEQLFPGLIDQCLAGGAVSAELGSQSRITYHGHTLPQRFAGIDGIMASRPFLEARLRERTLQLRSLSLRDGVEVTGLATEGTRGGAAVRGVALYPRGMEAGGEVLEADLVVDAMGRGGRSGAWLEGMGYPRAREERTRIDVTYASRHFALPPDALGADRAVMVGATASRPRGMVFAAQENGSWVVSLHSYGHHRAPVDDEEFLAFAATIAPPDVMNELRRAEPLDQIAVYRFPCGVRRRYDLLKRFPDGLLAVGDALCSVNPVYGAGISLAVREAVLLEECLAEEAARPLARRFFSSAHDATYPAWWLSKIGDYSLVQDGVSARLLGSSFRRLMAAAASDPKTASAVLRSLSFVDSPLKLVRPRILRQMLHQPTSRQPGTTAK
ncbi:NAD(P)/FAD-dependent oxidoreductase [Streptomyces sp. NPDC101206]|uniref:NAD(P)/FAD-dependent oxidoreductase n=1 Tax=Streptomyces sp. NPDC101206 TaxID=3366128 RepID=UPI0037FF9283